MRVGKVLRAVVRRARGLARRIVRPGARRAHLEQALAAATDALHATQDALQDAERRAAQTAERAERVQAELDSREHEFQHVDGLTRHAFIRHHAYLFLEDPIFTGRQPAVATGDEDHALVERIIAAYARSAGESYYGEASMWTDIHARVADIHQALLDRDVRAVADAFRDPAQNHVLYGFETFYSGSSVYEEHGRRVYVDATKDVLVRLAEALALIPLELPDGPWGEMWGTNIDTPVPEVVESIEKRLGVRVAIEPVQRGFTGLAADGGVITRGSLDGLHAAQRARSLVDGVGTPRIMEIGAGLGYSAYYARQLGLTDYTIVDLPFTSAVQAYFLGRVLGPDEIVLEGEVEDLSAPSPKIKLATPALMRDRDDCFQLVVNVNSLTEVGPALAVEYARHIMAIAPVFLSINHEANIFTVFHLFDDADVTIERSPHWLRNGYAEEIIRRR
jgi:hypothetical protein